MKESIQNQLLIEFGPAELQGIIVWIDGMPWPEVVEESEVVP